MHTASISFLLNDREIRTDAPAGLLVLDYLRRREHLVGTKEGCKEGDCGACGVLVGDLVDDHLVYRPVTSCLIPLGELQGKHLVTIEGLNPESGLTPLQSAIVDEGGTQCGFCTPGIVVSMTHCLMERRSKTDGEAMKTALSGHLCRCTGYGSLKRAATHLESLWTDADRAGDDGVFEHQLPNLVEKGILPAYFKDIPARIRELRSGLPQQPDDEPSPAFRIGGGTDLYVQRGEEIPDVPVQVLNNTAGLQGIHRENGTLVVGALTTFEQIAESPEFQELVPHIHDFMFLIASLQIRNRATLSGNVVNASPIGDVTMLLLALEAEVQLRAGETTRTVPLHRLYKGYKDLDKSPDEIVTAFALPVSDDEVRVNFEKISKRKCLDIASVNNAIKVVLRDNQIIHAALAAGGVAPIPKFLPKSSEFLAGKEVSEALVRELLPIVQSEIAPIDDVRGSADYKRLMTRQLVIAHFVKLFPDLVQAEAFL